jgi:hypothetical protein
MLTKLKMNRPRKGLSFVIPKPRSGEEPAFAHPVSSDGYGIPAE